MKRRGQRVTYQTVRAAVEEASGRRFLVSGRTFLRRLDCWRLPHSGRLPAFSLLACIPLLAGAADAAFPHTLMAACRSAARMHPPPAATHVPSSIAPSFLQPPVISPSPPRPAPLPRPQLTHVYQLKHLLPEMLELEWVRLPVAAHSSRTEPALSLALHAAAAAKVAVAEGAAPGGSGELQAARRLLHCRLAAHLLGSYRQHLTACCAALRSAGDDAGAAAVEEAAAAAEEAEPLPLARFLAPYPEEVSDVPQQAPPPLPTPARGGSPAVLVSDAAAAAQAALPLTPTSTKPQLPASTTGVHSRRGDQREALPAGQLWSCCKCI